MGLENGVKSVPETMMATLYDCPTHHNECILTERYVWWQWVKYGYIHNDGILAKSSTKLLRVETNE